VGEEMETKGEKERKGSGKENDRRGMRKAAGE